MYIYNYLTTPLWFSGYLISTSLSERLVGVSIPSLTSGLANNKKLYNIICKEYFFFCLKTGEACIQ